MNCDAILAAILLLKATCESRTEVILCVKRFSCNKADRRRRFSTKTKGKSRWREREESKIENGHVFLSFTRFE